MQELYAIPVTGGRYERVLATPAQALSFSRDGKRFLYQDRKGGEDDLRKHLLLKKKLLLKQKNILLHLVMV